MSPKIVKADTEQDIERLDVHAYSVEDDVFDTVLFCYDRSRSRDWPRQRNHYALGKTVDGWRPVIEVQSFDAYDPLADTPPSFEIASATIEPVVEWRMSGLPLPLQREMSTLRYDRIRRFYDSRSETLKALDQELLPIVSHAQPTVGQPPTGSPAMPLTKTMMSRGLSLVELAARSDDRKQAMPLWYRSPAPDTTKQRAGRSARSPRELAELALIYVTFAHQQPDMLNKAVAESFAAISPNPNYWSNLFAHVRDAEFIIGRRAGVAGGELSERAENELAAHTRAASR